MTHLKRLEEEISTWPNISIHPHRFGGREFRFGSAEVGHVHTGGVVDIPFPRSVRDALLAEGLAEEHRWVPNSGWTTFHVRDEGDLQHALWPHALVIPALRTQDGQRLSRDDGARERGTRPESPSHIPAPTASAHKGGIRHC